MRRAPDSLHTPRLLLRRPRANDADAIFTRYASDPEVTRYIGWARHTSIDHTRAFVAFSDSQWAEHPAGPYLAFTRDDRRLVGGTGLMFESALRASTGYVFARDAWGRGYATEALGAMVDLARQTGVARLYALCHAEHRASARVLEKCAFELEGTLRRYIEFPNLAPGEPQDVRCYSRIFEIASGTSREKRP
jgi:[ribosomal protein S5]-alanine N-acetyltransferase